MKQTRTTSTGREGTGRARRAPLHRFGPRGLLAVALLALLPPGAPAHEVPTDVTVHAYVAPEGSTLRFLVRIPMEAIRDIEFPLRGPGYLDLDAAGPHLRDAAELWIADYVEFFEDGRRLPEPRIVATRVSLPSDRSFTSYEEAVAHVTGPPLDPDTQLYWEQGMLDVLLAYRVESASSRFSLRPELAHLGLRTTTVLRFLPPDGETRVFQYHGDPGRVELDPRWHQAALRFIESGFHHILGGIDHLLFLLCLIIPFRSFWGLVPVVTSFTVAHSITLLASALGMAPDALWFAPLIETLIALSIVYMAFENIVGPKLEQRWLITFGFGLADHLRVRAGPRLRLRLRPPGEPPVLGLPPDHLAPGLQRGGGAGTAPGAPPGDPGAGAGDPGRRARADGGDPALGPRGPRGVALDDRAGRSARELPLPDAGAGRGVLGRNPPLADGGRDRGRSFSVMPIFFCSPCSVFTCASVPE